MKKIFVGNLDFGATEGSLRSLFAPHGAVESVNLVTDRETGRDWSVLLAGQLRESHLAFSLDATCVARSDGLCTGSTASESAIVAQLVPAAEIHWSWP